MFKISVIICTHNPREDYLRRVLAALQSQTLPKDQWELLLVDNASREPLQTKWDLSWHPHGRHLREDKIGKTNALLLAITEFKGELFVIVDDDNVLRVDYLEAALKISAKYPWLGAWGGSCIGEFEIEPSAELRPWMDGLVIEKLKTSVWAKLKNISFACPAGAGMVARRELVLYYQKEVLTNPMRQSLGHNGINLASGEDADMALCGYDLNLGTGRFPELELTHLIPARKLNLAYLERLHEGMSYAGLLLEAVHSSRGNFPGQIKSGKLRQLLMFLLLLLTRKSHIERRIRMAQERGRSKALSDLAQFASRH